MACLNQKEAGMHCICRGPYITSRNKPSGSEIRLENNLSKLVCVPVCEFFESLVTQRGLNLDEILALKNIMVKKQRECTRYVPPRIEIEG